MAVHYSIHSDRQTTPELVMKKSAMENTTEQMNCRCIRFIDTISHFDMLLCKMLILISVPLVKVDINV